MKVYTRGGDGGETSLFGGDRVRKDALRVEAYGEVDELNAFLGRAATEIADEDLGSILHELQRRLFDLGSRLAVSEARAAKGEALPDLEDADVERMEGWIDSFENELEPLRNFVLPGGARAAAALHVARTVARRAERRVVALASRESVHARAIVYLNRLSDLLFVMARVVNARSGTPEPLWSGSRR